MTGRDVDAVLASIDGALGDDLSEDAMRWTAEPPPARPGGQDLGDAVLHAMASMRFDPPRPIAVPVAAPAFTPEQLVAYIDAAARARQRMADRADELIAGLLPGIARFREKLAALTPTFVMAAEAVGRLVPKPPPAESRAALAGRRRVATQMRRVERRAARRARR